MRFKSIPMEVEAFLWTYGFLDDAAGFTKISTLPKWLHDKALLDLVQIFRLGNKWEIRVKSEIGFVKVNEGDFIINSKDYLYTINYPFFLKTFEAIRS